MKNIILLCIVNTFYLAVFAQVIPKPPPPRTEEVDKQEDVYLITEVMPEPEGGMEAFTQYLSKELKYPTKAKRLGVEGKVFLKFIVEKNGILSNIEIAKGIGSGCDEEAIRLIEACNDPSSNAPRWSSGKQRGRKVRVQYTIPIHFKL